jgi:peptidylprolyl isomerase
MTIMTLNKRDSMSRAKAGDVVKVHFTGTLDNGNIFASTKDSEPLEFTIGGGSTFQKFEEDIIGMIAGDTKKITVEPDDGFGRRDDKLVFKVDKEGGPQELMLEVGKKLQMKQENGKVVDIIVTEVDDATITLDANYPLAGKTLTFDVKLMEIV